MNKLQLIEVEYYPGTNEDIYFESNITRTFIAIPYNDVPGAAVVNFLNLMSTKKNPPLLNQFRMKGDVWVANDND